MFFGGGYTAPFLYSSLTKAVRAAKYSLPNSSSKIFFPVGSIFTSIDFILYELRAVVVKIEFRLHIVAAQDHREPILIIRPHAVKREVRYVKPLRRHLLALGRFARPYTGKKYVAINAPLGFIFKMKHEFADFC